MCFSAEASFATATILLIGGAYCIHAAREAEPEYKALAIMPVAVGIQQFLEGMVWTNASCGQIGLMNWYSFLYLFFMWIFWPSWTAVAAAALETNNKTRQILRGMAVLGLILGLSLYVPYAFHPEWLNVEIVQHSIAYSNDFLLPDFLIPRNLTYALYLFFVAAPMLISSHRHLRLFGLSLVVFVPVTYVLFIYAYASVLCFFAALSTIQIIYIIVGDRCQQAHTYDHEMMKQSAF